MAEHFYDVNHPARRKLHKAYIRKCLENFAENTGVIHYISAEFTGPLHFVAFWLDTIKEWELETGKKVLIGLSATKDVQDAILSDKSRSGVVDIIDIRYWFYREDGSLYAPGGGLNLAPRQHARLVNPGKCAAEQVYRAVNEYKTRYPEKAVIYSASGYDQYEWAAFMAGGSLPALPLIADRELIRAAAAMKPVATKSKDQWMLANKNNECIIFLLKGGEVELDLPWASGNFTIQKINPNTGKFTGNAETITAGKTITVNQNSTTPSVIFVRRAP